MNVGPEHVSTETARSMLRMTLIAEGLVSLGLIIAALVLHTSDPEVSDTLLVGVLMFWLGHANATAQLAAAAALEKASRHEG